MKDNDILEAAFWFNEDHYKTLDDDGKVNMLLVIQDLIDCELYRLYTGKAKQKTDNQK